MMHSVSIFSMSDNLSNSDTPLPTLRARDLCRRVQDAITPLPTLRAPATSCMDVDYVTPMPTLRVRRAVSPTAVEPEEENRHTLRETDTIIDSTVN